MSEDDRRGWWQASDLNWYPPELHADPAHRARYAKDATQATDESPVPEIPERPQTPPREAPTRVIEPAPMKGGAGQKPLLLAIAALVVIAIGAAVYLVVSEDDDDQATPTTTRPDSSSPIEITNAAQGWSVTLPGSFVAADLSGDTTATRQQLAAADPDSAEAFDETVSGLGASGRMCAIVPTSAPVHEIVTLLAGSPIGDLANDDVRQRVLANIAATGGTEAAASDARIGNGVGAYRVDYLLPARSNPAGVRIRQVYVNAAGQTWVLTQNSDPASADTSFVSIVGSLKING